MSRLRVRGWKVVPPLVSFIRVAAAVAILIGSAAGPIGAATAQSAPPPATAPVASGAPAASPLPAADAATAPARTLPAATTASGHDMSPWGMFMAADIVVKAVMVGLVFASLVTWTILFAKTLEFFAADRTIARAIARLRDCTSLQDAEATFPPNKRGVVSAVVREAADEARLSTDIGAFGGVRDRATARCGEAIRAEARRLRIGTGMLATIGATAPFVGLFGTVWGIMNSFVGIAKAQTTNLAVVAPGIAEALLATAIGLVAAIPAVIFYNHFARVTKNHLERVNRAAGIVLRLLSRDLESARPTGGLRVAAE